MLKNLRISIMLLLICGLAYPLVMTGISQLLMPEKAAGSIITNAEGNIIGSELIGQKFTEPHYFNGRVSSIEYNASGSGSMNYAPTNKDMVERTKTDLKLFLKNNPEVRQEDIPNDLLTNSGSGLDPHITKLAAQIQVPRIAQERGLSEAKLMNLIEDNIESRQFTFIGEQRINVLKLNIALDHL